MSRKRISASFTIEASVFVAVILLSIVLSVKAAIYLYEETVEITDVEENMELDQVKIYRAYAFGEDAMSFMLKKR